jgi:histone acetyltransferase (RNA polymerase elongator complex component)
MDVIPPYTRIKRLIRDIPATEIVAGSNVTNLSQLMHEEMKLKMENGELKMKEFYQRLYGEYTLFKTTKEFLKQETTEGSTLPITM